MEFEPLNIIKTVAELGGVGVAALLIWFGYKTGDRFLTLMTNHFVHFAEVLSRICTQTNTTNEWLRDSNKKLDCLCDLLREKNGK